MINFISPKKTQNSGFTLIEMMVAVSIFAIVMTISMAALLNIIAINRKSQAVKTVMNNLNFAMEEMSRDIRFGLDYECEDRGFYDTTSPPNKAGKGCVAGVSNPFISLKFRGIRDSATKIVYYYLAPQTLDTSCSSIYKQTRNLSNTITGDNPITAPEVCIKNNAGDSNTGLKFFVQSAARTDDTQARVLIILEGHAGAGQSKTDFNLQTTVTQRQINI
ncbi:MAG: type II secretion system protein [Candidatus Pacebacteria bacterium]|nr:type II secretion system protein [Candidatus Paceibacterota bacterium]